MQYKSRHMTHLCVTRCGDESGRFATKSWLERVVVMGVGRKPSKVSITTGQDSMCGLVCFELFPTQMQFFIMLATIISIIIM